MEMIDKVELQMMRKIVEQELESKKTLLYMIDDMMSEILILDNPESMREIASYVKDVIAQVEE